MLVRENMHTCSTYSCPNIAYNLELSHLYSLYTIYIHAVCTLYEAYTCRVVIDALKIDHKQCIFEKTEFCTQNNFTARGREFRFQGGGSFRNRKFLAGGRGEFTPTTLNAICFSRDGSFPPTRNFGVVRSTKLSFFENTRHV